MSTTPTHTRREAAAAASTDEAKQAQGTARPSRTRRIREELRIARDEAHVRLRAANMVCRLIAPMSLATFRAAIYRRVGFRIAERVSFTGAVTVIGGGRGAYRRLSIGAGCLIGYRPLFNLDETITLGRNVSLGPNVSIFTSTHLLGPASQRMNPNVIRRPVVIEDGVWVGVGAIILPGVTLGRGSVISAGAVVTESVPPNMLVSSNPAQPQQELPWQDE